MTASLRGTRCRGGAAAGTRPVAAALALALAGLLFQCGVGWVDAADAASDLATPESWSHARALTAMGINDVEAAVTRLFEAKRDVLEYANKNRAAADVVPETETAISKRSRGGGVGGSVSTAALLPTLRSKDPGTAPPTFGTCTTAVDCSGSRMMCVDGHCRCPVLFPGGVNCDEPRTPTAPWCLTPLASWPKIGPRYMQSKAVALDFSTCAIVGNAATMKGSGVGGQISSHTAVFRFNEAPFKGMEKDVGDKTTLRFQNRDRSGFAETKGEICVVREGKWYRGQNSRGKCRMEQMPEDVEKKLVDGHWKVHKQGAPADPGRPWMSNGFSGITFALHMCARVDVYGFTFGTGYYFTKYKGRAKDWGRKGGYLGPPSKALQNRHPWVKERACLQQLADELPQQVVIHKSADPKNAKPGGKNVKLPAPAASTS